MINNGASKDVPWRNSNFEGMKIELRKKFNRAKQTSTKFLKPISLMSFMQKKLLDRHTRDDVLSGQSLHQNQYAYQAGKSTETALQQLT